MWKKFTALFSEGASVSQISADDLKVLLDTNSRLVLIDVRTPSELTRGKIPQCINIPLDTIDSKIESIIIDKETPIYLYCLSGTRSDKAAHVLLQKGYKTVYSLTHGMLMWRYKKYPID